LRLFSFGGYGLALAALALVVFGAYDSYPYQSTTNVVDFQGKIPVLGSSISVSGMNIKQGNIAIPLFFKIPNRELSPLSLIPYSW